ncbi:MAG TPA: hypothetical protein VF706_02230 [Solirubrobacteraceae bacterium]
MTIDELTLADEPERWRALGFALDGDDGVLLGTIRVRLAGDGARTGTAPGFLGWSLRGLRSTELDGLPTTVSQGAPVEPAASVEQSAAVEQGAQDERSAPREPAAPHPNGVVAIDHVVAMTPALERTVAALQAAGLDLRRIRDEPTPAGAPRQAFFRLGEAIVEVVQEPLELVAQGGGAERPARLWGLALLAPDFDRTVGALGDSAGEPRDAVQPGRRIVTVRRSAGLAVPVAVMSPRAAP